MTVSDVSAIADQVASETEAFRADEREIRDNQDLTSEAKDRAVADARSILRARVEEHRGKALPLLADLTAANGQAITALSEQPRVTAAADRVAMALEHVDPAGLAADLAADSDEAALLYLRRVIASIGRRFTKDPLEARAYVGRLRAEIDQHLSKIAAPGSDVYDALATRERIDQAKAVYEGAVSYALDPGAQGLLRYGFARSGSRS